jgi:hypothetical protein
VKGGERYYVCGRCNDIDNTRIKPIIRNNSKNGDVYVALGRNNPSLYNNWAVVSVQIPLLTKLHSKKITHNICSYVIMFR